MFKILYKLFLLFTVAIYLSTFLSPAWLWIFGLASLIIPVLLLIHVISFVFWVLIKRKLWVYPTIGLIISIPYLLLTISFHSPKKKSPGLQVLSYNVQVFNVYKHLNEKFESSKKMIEWVRQDTSGIKCLQEFHNQKNSTLFNTTAIFSNGGQYEPHVKSQVINQQGHDFGLAIFSKYPVINKGMVVFEDSRSNNGAIYVDVVYGKDTIRIYNAHLESMSIDQNSIFNGPGFKSSMSKLIVALKAGMTTRAGQVGELMEHIGNCPFPVILCCDLNELPYSYVYHRIKSQLSNSFEKAGKGFGFSYNGKIPFLRIDNQFFSNRIEVLQYQIPKEINYSDHFPVKCVYTVEKNKQK